MKNYNTIKISIAVLIALIVWGCLAITLGNRHIEANFFFYIFTIIMSLIFGGISMGVSLLIFRSSTAKIPPHWYIFDAWSFFFVIFGLIGLCYSMETGYLAFSIGVPTLMIGLGLQHGVRKNKRMLNKVAALNSDTAPAESE